MSKVFRGYGPGERGTGYYHPDPTDYTPPTPRPTDSNYTNAPVGSVLLNIDVRGTGEALGRLTDEALDRMAGLLMQERGRRLTGTPPSVQSAPRASQASRDVLAGGWAAFSNFLLGAAHAMAARAALRTSRGHVPFASRTNGTKSSLTGGQLPYVSGGTPAHGRDWHAADGAALERLVITSMPVLVKNRGQRPDQTRTCEFVYNPLLMKADGFRRRFLAGQGELLAEVKPDPRDARPASLTSAHTYANPGVLRVSNR